MADTRIGRPGVLLLAAIACVYGGCGDGGDAADGDAPVVTDSAGVRVVANRVPDGPADWTVVPLGELMPPDSALVAVPWGVVAAPEAGRIFAVDWIGNRVVWFHLDGAWGGELGRSGEGPGEFGNPVALALGPDGDLRVWDLGRGVLSRWTGEGDLVEELPPPVGYWGPGMHVLETGLVTVTSEGAGLELDQRLVEVGADGEPAVLHSLPREMVMAELPCGSFPSAPVFAPDLVWDAQGDTVWVVRTPDYRIDGLVKGRLMTSIRRPVALEPVTDAMAVERAAVGQFAMMARRCGVTPVQLVEAVGHEPVLAAIQDIHADPLGRLWVSRASSALVPDAADLFAPDGRYLGTVAIPGIPVAFPAPDRVVLLSYRMETQMPVLTLYALEEAG